MSSIHNQLAAPSAVRTKRHSIRSVKLKKYSVLYLMLIPAVVLTFIFNYIPMFSNVIAFMDYDMFNG